MSFSKNLTITVRNTTAQLNEPLCVYEKDRNLMIYFKIMDYKYKFDKNPTNVLASVDDIMEAYATIVDPNGYELTRRYGEVVDDEIKFVITEDLIDEIEEIGTYKLQFHIKCQHSEFTIPEISFEVLERLKGIRTVTDEGVVGDTILNNAESFIDAEGKLNLVWERGDTISSVRLNQMVEVINNAVDEEHQRQINEVNRENRANAKLNELETRFSALTTSQQQSAEVIDARDGEASLKARLDRDIEKAKQIYVDVEGSNISTDSAAGYLKDVEILGNTLVNLAGTLTNKGQIPSQNLFNLPENFISKIKPNTVYTVYCNTLTGKETSFAIIDHMNGGHLCKETPIENPSSKTMLIKFTSPSDAELYKNITCFFFRGVDFTEEDKSPMKMVMLEGDHTQNPPSYFEGIASVGDKVEGQELYEIPVLSCGKNLFDGKLELGYYSNGNPTNGNNIRSINFIKVKPNTNYSYVVKNANTNIWSVQYDKDLNFIKNSYKSFITDANCSYIKFYTENSGISSSINTIQIQLEEGTVATPYEPYQEDKLTILSPVQLEKVGDVADRIICKDGVWEVEKNNIKVNLKDLTFVVYKETNDIIIFNSTVSVKTKDYLNGISNKLKYSPRTWNDTFVDDSIGLDNSTLRIFVKFKKSTLSAIEDFNKFKEDLFLLYQREVCEFIPLPHDQQVKLRTFANKTNIQFLTTIEGTIKAQVPKSLGATVNIQNEQIGNLNKELDRVKKLEESTVSTVETESGFTTVEATSGGYFEDVKLEGRTLVNKFVYSHNGTEDTTKEIICKNYRDLNTGKFTVPNITNKQIGFNLYNRTTDRFMQNITVPPYSNVVVDLDKEDAYLYNIHAAQRDGWNSCDELKEIAMFIPGDLSDYSLSFFEGLKSVGDGADEIVVESVKGDGNLVDPNLLLDTYQTCFIPRNTTFTVSCDVFNRIDNNYVRIHFYDKNKTQIDYFNVNIRTVDKRDYRTFTIASDIHYIQFKTMNVALNSSNYAINIGNDYILKPHQSDKKRLLYYNPETQTWEKPVLREWDSIEKHSDGKYYYHQRSGEVVLNGSENWKLSNTYSSETHIWFFLNILSMNSSKTVICDKFIYRSDRTPRDIEYIYTDQDVNILIDRTKLETQDVAGFKQWLQTNPVTVVYQLAQEKVYECTNIDLITYANETNYIIESGAITPKSTLKVHNNISNVVNLLQKKVSILESNFITMFKAVLSGDYQTLAYSLYPEDFNNTEDTNNQ